MHVPYGLVVANPIDGLKEKVMVLVPTSTLLPRSWAGSPVAVLSGQIEYVEVVVVGSCSDMPLSMSSAKVVPTTSMSELKVSVTLPP